MSWRHLSSFPASFPRWTFPPLHSEPAASVSSSHSLSFNCLSDYSPIHLPSSTPIRDLHLATGPPSRPTKSLLNFRRITKAVALYKTIFAYRLGQIIPFASNQQLRLWRSSSHLDTGAWFLRTAEVRSPGTETDSHPILASCAATATF